MFDGCTGPVCVPCVAARGRIIGIEHLPEHVSAPQLRQGPAGRLESVIAAFVREKLAAAQADGEATYDAILAELEKPMLREIMRFTDGNQALASRLLSIHRTTLRKKLEQLRDQ